MLGYAEIPQSSRPQRLMRNRCTKRAQIKDATPHDRVAPPEICGECSSEMDHRLTSRKRRLVAEAKQTGPDLDLHGWIHAYASWTSYQQSRANAPKPGSRARRSVCVPRPSSLAM